MDVVPPKRSYAWFVLFMLVVLYLLNCADRYVAVGLLENIKTEFDISDTYVALLIGPMFALIYTLLAIPIARYADKYNRVKIIAVGAFIWSLFTVLTGMAKTPELFAVARIGVGVGEAAFLAPAFSILADYFEPKRRALAFAVLNFGVYFGQIFGLVGGAAIAEATDWRMAFYVLGLPGILMAVATVLLVREPVRGQLDGGAAMVAGDQQPFLTTLKQLWKARTFRLMTFGTALGGFASYGFGYWAPTLFSRVFELSQVEANTRYGGPSFIAGITGAIVLGILCDRLTKQNARWPFWLCAFGLIGFCISMLILCFTDSVNFATLLTLPAGLLAGGWVIAMQAALQDLLPAKPRATATSIWGFALTFSGMVLGVQMVGTMNDFFIGQYGDDAIRYSMAITISACIPAALLIFMAGKTAEADQKLLKSSIG